MAGTLVILDSVAAARAWLARGRAPDSEVLSTHCSVVDFLGARGVEVRDGSDFVDSRGARTLLLDCARRLDEELARLDGELSAAMCAAAGLPALSLLKATYKYRGQYQLAGLTCLRGSIERSLARGDIGALQYFHAMPTSRDPVFSFVDEARGLASQRGVAFEAVEVQQTNSSWRHYLRSLSKLHFSRRGLAQLRRALHARVAQRLRNSQPRPAVPCALLLDPDAHSFFEDGFAGTGVQVVRVPPDGNIPVNDVARANEIVARMRGAASRWREAAVLDPDSWTSRLALDFVDRAGVLLTPLARAQVALGEYDVRAAAWDVPLVTRPQLNVVNELFLARHLPVFGRQHGGSYVDQDLGGIHFDSDFDRCTHYFSYGFGEAEFRATYPARAPRCTFLPAGHPPLPRASSRPRVDIAFPPSLCNPLPYFAHLPAAELARRQSRIIAALDARHDLDNIVKLPPGYGHDSFAVVEQISRLEHVRTSHEYWSDFLAHCAPRLIVCELASTPLLQALDFDSDIFLLPDPTFPFSVAARALLEKRVHVFDSIEELEDAIRRYDPESGPRRRDDGFYRTYANRGTANPADLLRAPTIMTTETAPCPRR